MATRRTLSRNVEPFGTCSSCNRKMFVGYRNIKEKNTFDKNIEYARTDSAKQLILNLRKKGLLDDLKRVISDLIIYGTPLGKYSEKIDIKQLDVLRKEIYKMSIADKSYLLKISLNPDVLKYNTHAISQMKALEILNKNGFNIIETILAYTNKTTGKSVFIADWSDLMTVEEAEKKKIISKETRLAISKKYSEIMNDLKKKDNVDVRELTARNLFIDTASKPYKVFIFDPVLSYMPAKK